MSGELVLNNNIVGTFIRNGVIFSNRPRIVEKVLWTNPNSTNSFAAQTVTLSDSINNYKYIKISGKYYITSTDKLSAVMSVEDFRKCLIYTTSKATPEFTLCYNDSSSTPIASFRRISYVSDTQIAIDVCRFAGSTSTSADRTIPLEIIGVK